LIRDPANSELIQALIEEAIMNGTSDIDIDSLRADEIFRKAIDYKPETAIAPVRKLKSYRWIAAASIILLLASASYYYFKTNYTANKEAVTAKTNNEQQTIPPASNRATLTLGDGTVITLDSSSNDILALQGNTNIIRLSDGSILYQAGNSDDTIVTYNTISTPKGGQYQIILPDSTHVWLNAASSLRFPTVFKGGTRDVVLSGEAYFEVKKNKTKPFLVSVEQSVITVLGTSFNINAYSDEKDISTTLLEGSVRFSRNNTEELLKPGEQVICLTANNTMHVQEADIRQVMSWKNGFFEFENLDLPIIMRQISRWYDVDLVYEGVQPELKLSGGISRKLSLQDLQKLMEANGVLFRIEGKKLIVGH
ncbi:MAG: FecR family protein, partial [Chitinophagaceae bacterium]|nr:FecR family protein [Chitinophagaceae bacterium]